MSRCRSTASARSTARYVIAADGMWSPLRKVLGLAEPGYLGEWHAFRQYARNVTGPAARRLYVWFEPDLLPGYAWSFPLPDGRVNIGFGVLRDGSRTVQDMKRLWPELLGRPHIVDALGADVELEDRHTAWPIPAGIDQAVLVARPGAVRRRRGAGDRRDDRRRHRPGAAHRAPRRRGHRRRRRARSPRPCAPATSRRAPPPGRRPSHVGMLLSGWLARPRGRPRRDSRSSALNGWTRRNFARWMFEDEPRAVAAHPRALAPPLPRRPGAFVAHVPLPQPYELAVCPFTSGHSGTRTRRRRR